MCQGGLQRGKTYKQESAKCAKEDCKEVSLKKKESARCAKEDCKEVSLTNRKVQDVQRMTAKR